MADMNNNGIPPHDQAGNNERVIPTRPSVPAPLDPGAENLFDKTRITPKTAFGEKAAEGFPVSFLAKLPIPSPGITIIGARTEGGKTTAMINIFRELLEKGKRVIFVTLEQRAAEIYTMLCLSKARADKPDIDTSGLTIQEAGEGRSQGFTSAFISYFHNDNPKHHHRAIQATVKHYNGLMSGDRPQLSILDCVNMEGWSYPAFHEYIKQQDPDAVIIDYLQIMPTAGDRYTGYERIADITKEIIRIGNRRAVITGAQFNRQPGKEGKQGKDNGTFDPDLDLFREAADIEHAASLAIGIGYFTQDNGDRGYFYKVLKSRYGGGSGARYLPSTGGYPDYQWSYAKPSSDPWQREKPGKQGKASPDDSQAGISSNAERMG